MDELENEYTLLFDTDLKIIDCSKEITIIPKEYGLSPDQAITCVYYDGFFGSYNIDMNGIILDEFHIYTYNHIYPPINGVLPSGIDIDGHHIYKHLSLKINYTGKILVAKQPVERFKLYKAATKHSAWAYTTLLELIYENGEFIKMIDHSDTASKIRQCFQSEKGFVKRYYTSLKKQNGDIFKEFDIDDAWWMKPHLFM